MWAARSQVLVQFTGRAWSPPPMHDYMLPVLLLHSDARAVADADWPGEQGIDVLGRMLAHLRSTGAESVVPSLVAAPAKSTSTDHTTAIASTKCGCCATQKNSTRVDMGAENPSPVGGTVDVHTEPCQGGCNWASIGVMLTTAGRLQAGPSATPRACHAQGHVQRSGIPPSPQNWEPLPGHGWCGPWQTSHWPEAALFFVAEEQEDPGAAHPYAVGGTPGVGDLFSVVDRLARSLPLPMQQVPGAALPHVPAPGLYRPGNGVSGNQKPDTPWDELIALAHYKGFHRIAVFDEDRRAQRVTWATCARNAFSCPQNDPSAPPLRRSDAPPCCPWMMETFARQVVDSLDAAHVVSWAVEGTALGIERNSRSIPWTNDIDFALLPSGVKKLEGEVQHEADKRGYPILFSAALSPVPNWMQIPRAIQTMPYMWVRGSAPAPAADDVAYLTERLVNMNFHSTGHPQMTWPYYVDFYDEQTNPDECRPFGVCVHKAPLLAASLGGREVRLHPDYLKHLEHAYGAGFRTPDIDYFRGERCATAFSGKCQQDTLWESRTGVPIAKKPKDWV